jgi:isoquinoline 1-oxidoreductase beta subunit
MIKDGVDGLSVEARPTCPTPSPTCRSSCTPRPTSVPVLWWRSVGSTHTAYSTETFLDRLAAEGKQDPVALRLKLLESTRAMRCCAWPPTRPAGARRWPGKPGERRGRGVAVHESFHSFVAQVAEVTVAADGSVKVDRIVAAVDCGMAINPDNVRAQVEGSVGFALSAALHGEITLKDGVVEQGNFGEYAPIRINEMPKVEVHIVPPPKAHRHRRARRAAGGAGGGQRDCRGHRQVGHAHALRDRCAEGLRWPPRSLCSLPPGAQASLGAARREA